MKTLFLFSILFPMLSFADATFSPAICESSKAPLFQTEEALDLKMKGIFPLVGTPRYQGVENQNPITPAVISYSSQEGEKSIPIQVQARAKSRNNFCAFKPIRIIWNDQDNRQDTVFSKLHGKDMKLVVHCEYTSGTIAQNQPANEAVIKEYALYKILKALGLPTFEVRLARIQYMDPSGNPTVEGMGFFMESDASIAKRCNVNHVKSAEIAAAFRSMDQRLEISYLISRLIVDARDYIAEIGHNTEFFIDANNVVKLELPYDFNDSILVLGRHFEMGFGNPPTPWFQRLEQGPYSRDGELTYLVPELAARWKAQLNKQSLELVAKREAVMSVIDQMPMSNSAKEAFRSRMNMIMQQLQQVAADTAAQ